jgi:DNA polymerase phi
LIRGDGADEADLQTESIHFKARILDLYEVFAKKQPTNPLVIELLLPLLNITKNSGNAAAALSNKASSLIRSRFTKPKDLPLDLSAQAGKEALEGIHDLARKSYSGEFTALCSICSVFVARAMDANNSDKEVVEVYSKTLEEYMTHKATQLHATFLNDYFKRHAIRAWPLHSTLVKFLNPGKAINIYRQTVAYELLAQLAPQLPTISKTHQKEVEALIPQAIEAFYATLESAKEDEGWKADKLKDFLKPMLAFARATKVMGHEWDLERLDKVIEGTNDTRLGGLKSVTSMLAQLRAVIAKGGKGEVKAAKSEKAAKGEKSGKGDKSSKTKGEVKANGSTKKSKKRSNGEMTEDVEMAEPTTDSLPPVIAPPKKRKESSDSKPSKSKKAKTPKA